MTGGLAMTAALHADHDVFQEPSPQASKCNSEDRLTSRNIAKSLNNSKILRENKFQEQRCESGETFAIFSQKLRQIRNALRPSKALCFEGPSHRGSI